MSRLRAPLTRRLAPPLAALLAALLTACGEAATAPAPNLAVAGTTTVAVLPFSGTTWTPCGNGGAGEQLAYAGEILVLETAGVSEGGVQRYRSHYQTRNVVATGLTTGAVYHMLGTSQNGYSEAADGATSQTTLVSQFRLVTAGAGNDLVAHLTSHLTIDAEGNRRADIVNSTYECR